MTFMIRNGLYAIRVEMLDGVQGGNIGVMVLRDGTIRGGDSFFYCYGTYTSGGGKWKGEVTNQEHTQSCGARPVRERKVVSIGFAGTYTDEGAEADATAFDGKKSFRFRSTLRLLVED
jgi:hypothetical protein